MPWIKEDTNRKPWPKDCPWPEPTAYSFDYDEEFLPLELDEETEEMLEAKYYFDSLVEEGRLREDYTLNEEYEEDDDEFCPEKGEDFWFDNHFDIELWRSELSEHFNLLRIAPMDTEKDPVVALRSAFRYEFKNENLIRQAFTRRSFQIEYGLSGCSEELEFIGDSILSFVVVKELATQFSVSDCDRYDAPFNSKYNEGELSKLREQFVSKEALASRARELGIGKYILYGTGEKESDSTLSDMMEALIGAVAIDSGWDEKAIEEMVDDLLLIQLDTPDSYLKASYYDILNSWHQKHFGFIPEYEVYEDTGNGGGYYTCYLKYRIPENDIDLPLSNNEVGHGSTRSRARDDAAKRAYYVIVENGLWKNLKDAEVVPDIENSINQLQELYQKKYLDHAPEYEYSYDDFVNRWHVYCRTEEFSGWGKAKSKVKAKKIAAYMVIVHLLRSAGIKNDDWEKTIWQNMEL